MHKHLYSRFLGADPGRLHFAAHSHHPWPDLSREAHLRYWDDSARLIDHKWEYIFGEVVPTAQKNIAAFLNLSRPEQICFAVNTHEFIARLLSCFDLSKKLRVLTTDGEFHSFERQISRYAELAEVEVKRVAVEPFESFEERFTRAANDSSYQFIFFSQVFFALGYALKDLKRVIDRINSQASIVIDGYHGFCALATDLSQTEQRIFYLAGGYKYAQSGEGVCFMHVPVNCKLRPLNTGWYASFETLDGQAKQVTFPEDGFRFWGATFDPSGIYRFNAYAELLRQNNLSILGMHQYVLELQNYFLKKLESVEGLPFSKRDLIQHDPNYHAHFLSFHFAQAKQVCEQLGRRNVICDVRGDYLRLGFGIYQERKDIDELFERLKN